jgi:hypothetical protein
LVGKANKKKQTREENKKNKRMKKKKKKVHKAMNDAHQEELVNRPCSLPRGCTTRQASVRSADVPREVEERREEVCGRVPQHE